MILIGETRLFWEKSVPLSLDHTDWARSDPGTLQ